MILLSKLFRRTPDKLAVAQYRHYLHRPDTRQMLHSAKQIRGRKRILPPDGTVYDLRKLFDELNSHYFNGSIPPLRIGWSVKGSRTTLGHYDPSHHMIVLTKLLDSEAATELAVKYVLFHEMLHLKHPTEYRTLRRCVHTREFKEAEKQFEGLQKAKLELQRFVELVTERRS